MAIHCEFRYRLFYGCTSRDEQRWIPGRVVRIRNPYARMASNDTTTLRIDTPSQTCVLQPELVSLCWNCLKIGGRDLKSCAKCHKAHYCSRACQEADLKDNGHRDACEFLRLGRTVVPLLEG